MMNIFKILLVSLFVTTTAYPAAVIFSGNDVKTLKSNIDLNSNAKILSGTVDPTSVATSAPKGSLYLNTSTGLTYRKLDAGSSTNWIANANSTDSADMIENASLVGVTASGTMSISIKTKAGTDPSANDPVRLGFRSTTLTSGAYATDTITAAETLAIPGTSVLGMYDTASAYAVYVYAIYTGSGAKLGVSGSILDESQLYTSVAYTTDADGGKTLVSNAVQTSKPIRLIGQITMQGAAWSGIISVSNWPFKKPKHTQTQIVQGTATITLDCDDSYIWAEPSGGNVTINLPSIATCPMKEYYVFNSSNASAYAVITGSGGQLVGKAATTFRVPGQQFVTIINSSAEGKWIIKSTADANTHRWAALINSNCTISDQVGGDIVASITDSGGGKCITTWDSGFWDFVACSCSNMGGVDESRFCSMGSVGTSAFHTTTRDDAGTGTGNLRQAVCMGRHL